SSPTPKGPTPPTFPCASLPDGGTPPGGRLRGKGPAPALLDSVLTRRSGAGPFPLRSGAVVGGHRPPPRRVLTGWRRRGGRGRRRRGRGRRRCSRRSRRR